MSLFLSDENTNLRALKTCALAWDTLPWSRSGAAGVEELSKNSGSAGSHGCTRHLPSKYTPLHCLTWYDASSSTETAWTHRLSAHTSSICRAWRSRAFSLPSEKSTAAGEDSLGGLASALSTFSKIGIPPTSLKSEIKKFSRRATESASRTGTKSPASQ